MIPFDLAQPSSLAEAVGLLKADDPSIRPIAGGTAVMLMLKSGLFRPTTLVSLRGIEPEFRSVAATAEGGLALGAMVPLAALEKSSAVRSVAPVIAETMRTLSNIRVRNVATVGGALAHADPHMDLPPVLMALDARATVTGAGGERILDIGSLLRGYYETALGTDELVSRVTVPSQRGWRSAYLKCTTRAADDWPALGIAVSLRMEADTIREARLVLGAAADKATRLGGAEAVLAGTAGEDRVLSQAGEAAAAEASIIADNQGSAAYKRQLLRVYLGRAVRRALAAPEGGAA
ncbi:MAG: xanthine dehydrogenase family protein subunit M [Alphaproteobacteria bacterium]